MVSPSKVSLVLLLFWLALFAGAKTNAQSALDGFDPNANGTVRAIVVQPDGKILIGGDFTSLAPNGGVPVTRNHIARLNPDGTLDTAFDPNANGAINAIALQADGKVVVGGAFTGTNSIGGQTRNGIARLDPVTGAADSFDPNASGTISTLAVQTDGKILAGGAFSSIGGQTRSCIARLDANTGVADSFDPNASSYVNTIVLQTDGKILAGGGFFNIGGQHRVFLARLDPVTGLADSFDPFGASVKGSVMEAIVLDPSCSCPTSFVAALAVQADGKILVGGSFSAIGGQDRHGMARVDPITGLADSFDPQLYGAANAGALAIAVLPDGRVIAAGTFFVVNGQARRGIARLDPVTGLADSFYPNADIYVLAVAVQQDGKIVAGGSFTAMAPNEGASVTRNHIARLEKDGRLDRTVNLNIIGNTPSGVSAIAVQPDGKFLIGGNFFEVLGVQRYFIARLHTDGTVDMDFNPQSQGGLSTIAVQADGKILVGGGFPFIGGQYRNNIARLDPVTGQADSFNPNSDGIVTAIAIQVDGKILIGGQFTHIGGQPRNYLARLDPVTGLADSWNPMLTDAPVFGGKVHTITVERDGKILIGGYFDSIGDQSRTNIARLDPVTGLADAFDPHAISDFLGVEAIVPRTDNKILVSGLFSEIGGQARASIGRLDSNSGLADAFDPHADTQVTSIIEQADGKILASGQFRVIGGQTRGGIARLNGMSGMADSFDPGPHNGSFVYGIGLQADGKVLVGDGQLTMGGQERHYFARLSNDIASIQNLNVTSTAITWTLGGSSPQFVRVTFEFSNDNVNFVSLGPGTPVSNNWTLTGPNLPTNQNLYVRARGYYRTGTYNGCESIIESVRNAFIPFAPTHVVSRKIHGGAGPFDIDLPLIGSRGVECRTGGVTGDYQLIFSFPNPITSVGGASVTSGTGSVASRMIDTDAHNYIVNLTGVTNAQTINITLTNVNDNAGNSSNSISVPMAVLIGDVNGNGSVNASDVAQTKVNSGVSIGAMNFRSDTNANGSINASDVSLVKANSGTALPTAPSGARRQK